MSTLDRLECDIDLRLFELWKEAWEVQEWTAEALAAFLRAAYGKGYCDALKEEDKGKLCKDYGYPVPGK